MVYRFVGTVFLQGNHELKAVLFELRAQKSVLLGHFLYATLKQIQVVARIEVLTEISYKCGTLRHTFYLFNLIIFAGTKFRIFHIFIWSIFGKILPGRVHINQIICQRLIF